MCSDQVENGPTSCSSWKPERIALIKSLRICGHPRIPAGISIGQRRTREVTLPRHAQAANLPSLLHVMTHFSVGAGGCRSFVAQHVCEGHWVNVLFDGRHAVASGEYDGKSTLDPPGNNNVQHYCRV